MSDILTSFFAFRNRRFGSLSPKTSGLIKRGAIAVLAAIIGLGSVSANAQGSLVAMWRNGLAGSRLTAYSGSYITNRSSLTVITLCRNGRFMYTRGGSWRTPRGPGLNDPSMSGANRSQVTGRWDVRQQGMQVYLVYQTDAGQTGGMPVYLQRDQRVNLGGTPYRVQRNAAGC